LGRIKTGEVHSSILNAVFSPDGKYLAVVGWSLSAWETATGKLLFQSATRSDTTGLLAYSPDGKTLYTASSTGIVQSWDAGTGKRLTLCLGPRCNPLAVTFADNKVVAAGLEEQTVYLWEVVPAGGHGKLLGPERGNLGPVLSLGFPPGGRELISASSDSVCAWDAGSGRLLRRVAAPKGRQASGVLALSPDGKCMICSDVSYSARVVETDHGEELFRLYAGFVLHDNPTFQFSANGAFLAGGHGTLGKGVEVWNMTTGRPVRKVEGKEGAKRSNFALSADGKRVALGSSRGEGGPGGATWELVIAEVDTGKQLATIQRANDSLESLAFSSDGTLLASGGQNLIHLWDAATGSEVAQLGGEAKSQTSLVTFSPDSRLLAAVVHNEEQSKVVVWELASVSVRREFAGHRNQVTALAFSPDRSFLATGGSDSTVLLWDLAGRLDEPIGTIPSSRELQELWSELANASGSKGDFALRKLAAVPKEAVSLVGKNLQPVAKKVLEPKEIAKLIADLEDDSFLVRDKATRELEQAGQAAKPALVRALAAMPAADKRRRLEELLDRLGRTGPVREMLRPIRAVELLERIGTPEARQVLEAVSKGDADARLTQEAKAALQRLSGREPVAAPR
jgi:WD40 repeat protein